MRKREPFLVLWKDAEGWHTKQYYSQDEAEDFAYFLRKCMVKNITTTRELMVRKVKDIVKFCKKS